MTPNRDRSRFPRRGTLVASMVLLLILALGLSEAAGFPVFSAAARLEARRARAAVTLLMLDATGKQGQDLDQEIRAAVEAAGLELPSPYTAGYHWRILRSRRLGPGEYRVSAEVSLDEECSSAGGAVDRCQPYQDVAQPLLVRYEFFGCNRAAKFRVTLAEPPAIVPENPCAQALYDSLTQ